MYKVKELYAVYFKNGYLEKQGVDKEKTGSGLKKSAEGGGYTGAEGLIINGTQDIGFGKVDR